MMTIGTVRMVVLIVVDSNHGKNGYEKTMVPFLTLRRRTHHLLAIGHE